MEKFSIALDVGDKAYVESGNGSQDLELAMSWQLYKLESSWIFYHEHLQSTMREDYI